WMWVDLDPGPVGGAGVIVGQIGPLRPGHPAVQAAVDAGVQDALWVPADLPVVQGTRGIDRVGDITDGVRVRRPQVREVDPVRRAGELSRGLPRGIADPARRDGEGRFAAVV